MELPLSAERHEPLSRGGREILPLNRVHLREGTPVVTRMTTPSFGVEQYRALAVQIEERVNPIGTWGYALTVTSAEAGAGKTLTSLNLALSLVRGEERRVLLVEADLWRPRLYTYLDPEDPKRPGLHQVLDRSLPLAEAVVRLTGSSLDLLPAGADGAAGDVLSGRRMSEVLTEMRSAYEIVVIDSPPMELMASARSLASRSDGTVLVVRSGQSKRQDIERALATLGPEKVVGVVLNGVRAPRRGYRYYD